MVNVTKHNTPALRFDMFDGEWVPRTMRNCGDYSKGSGYSKKYITDEGTPVIHYGRLYTNYESAITNIDTFASPQPGSVISRGDEVLVPASGETAEDIVVASALLQPGVLIGGDLNVIRPNPGINPIFLALGLSSGAARDTLVKRAQGKSVVHLRNSDIQEAEVSFPALEEQQAIGELFSDLDALIEQHRAKHANLQQTKTALLQRMFPQDGADEPELRLGGFSGHWKRVLLGDTVESFKYGVNAAATDYDGVTKYLRITDLDESSGQFGTGLVTSPRAEEETIRDFLLEEGDMVFARTGATVGRSYLFRKSVGRTVWAGFLIRARFKRNTDPQFVAAYAQTDSYWTYVKLTSQRSGQPGLNSAEYAAMPITTPPTLEEQRAIGEVFSNLDALIAAEHRYIAQLTQAKTALLQRMFV